MGIDDKYIGTIMTSLEHSIRYTREWHQKQASEHRKMTGEPYYYDYEKESIAPIQEALIAIKNNIKKR
jgi:hypothetical protein